MNRVLKFLDDTFLDLGRQFKWTYLPPLMVYVAAGISGLTGIVGTFFVKDYLNLSAAFLAGLTISETTNPIPKIIPAINEINLFI